MSNSKVEQMFTPKQTAQMLNLSLRTVHNLIQMGRRDAARGAIRQSRGIYPTYKFSHKCRRIPEGAIIAFRNRCGPAAEQLISA